MSNTSKLSKTSSKLSSKLSKTSKTSKTSAEAAGEWSAASSASSPRFSPELPPAPRHCYTEKNGLWEGQQRVEGQASAVLPLQFGTYSRPGNDPMKSRSENQDCFVVEDDFGRMGTPGFLACVFDGHGPNGGLVSSFCRDIWPALTLAEIGNRSGGDIATSLRDGSEGDAGEGDVGGGSSASQFVQSLETSCARTSSALTDSLIDCYVSGTTLTAILAVGTRAWSINVGDSRCVGAVKTGAMYKAVDLTRDQNPDRPDEQVRILEHGGRVFGWGVPRVWLAEADMPGLAMSRSFGDLAAESVGVFSTPEVQEFQLDSEMAFVIVASDGVWEFISSDEAVEIVSQFHAMGNSSQEACNELIAESSRRWNEEEDMVDDITAVVVYNLDFGADAGGGRDETLAGFSLDGDAGEAGEEGKEGKEGKEGEDEVVASSAPTSIVEGRGGEGADILEDDNGDVAGKASASR
jgi:serine/threonine protein phosphatase PrpC